ncbi:hypothetical protein GCM10009798_43280 [Nocardioides panacihumi]|uniref:DUF1876 domain-containing protein n=1 Tax=Nocardioides panacihumi TaxID=400774 RepID=A0ABN2RYV2_9ACTN
MREKTWRVSIYLSEGEVCSPVEAVFTADDGRMLRETVTARARRRPGKRYEPCIENGLAVALALSAISDALFADTIESVLCAAPAPAPDRVVAAVD